LIRECIISLFNNYKDFLGKALEPLSAPNYPTTEKIKSTNYHLNEYIKTNKMYNPDENLIIRVKI